MSTSFDTLAETDMAFVMADIGEDIVLNGQTLKAICLGPMAWNERTPQINSQAITCGVLASDAGTVSAGDVAVVRGKTYRVYEDPISDGALLSLMLTQELVTI